VYARLVASMPDNTQKLPRSIAQDLFGKFGEAAKHQYTYKGGTTRETYKKTKVATNRKNLSDKKQYQIPATVDKLKGVKSYKDVCAAASIVSSEESTKPVIQQGLGVEDKENRLPHHTNTAPLGQERLVQMSKDCSEKRIQSEQTSRKTVQQISQVKDSRRSGRRKRQKRKNNPN
jgi:hypothetical protein